VIFSPRISKLVAFTIEKTKKKNLFLKKTTKYVGKKAWNSMWYLFFAFVSRGFFFFVFAVYKTKQLKS
jgi:hypothetical protein